MDQQDETAEQAEYEALRSATDPIAAFNLFVKRNVDPSLHAHFSDSDDNEAEFVRRAIRAAMVPRVVLAAGGGRGGGYPGGGGGAGTVVNGVAVSGGYPGAGAGGGGRGSAEDPRPRYH